MLLRAAAAPADRPVLDVAPHAQIRRLLRRMAGPRYVGVDRFEDRAVDVWADLTALPFRSDAFGLIVCYHVLEHVPDDASAIAELARVLAGDGVMLVQVPWREHRLTDEDPSAGAEERVRRFGQEDHVRWYGTDFEDRLRDGGLQPVRLRPRELLTPAQLDAFRLMPDEVAWLCTLGAPAAGIQTAVGALARAAECRARRAAVLPGPLRAGAGRGTALARRVRRRLARRGS